MLPDKVRAALIPCDRLVGIQAVNCEIGLRGLKIQVPTKTLFMRSPLLDTGSGIWINETASPRTFEKSADEIGMRRVAQLGRNRWIANLRPAHFTCNSRGGG